MTILRKKTKQKDAKFEGIELYTLRHTCLTRWAPHMDRGRWHTSQATAT
jgi:hypothetical protein